MFRRVVSWKTSPALKCYRMAKYKQRRQIMTRSFMREFEYVQAGGCTGLAFFWVDRRRKHPAETAADRIASLNTKESWKGIDEFAYSFNKARGDFGVNRIMRVAPHGCGLQCGAWVEETDFVAFQSTLDHLAAWPGFHILEMRFNQAVAGHICAMQAGLDGLRFFDPNSGEYVAAPKSEAAFLRLLTAHYKTYVSSTGKTMPLTFLKLCFYHVG